VKHKHIFLIILLILFNLVVLKVLINKTVESQLSTLTHNFVTKEDILNLEHSSGTQEGSVLSIQNGIVKATEKISKSVVSVNVLKRENYRGRSNNIFDNLFGYYPRYRDVQSIGTGVIITEDGYIITNAHVVDKAIDITVVLNDGSYKKGSIVGIAIEHDIAVLKIEGEIFEVADIGDSDMLRTGEWAVALGNPYGFVIKDSKPTVSVGVISALNRNFSDNHRKGGDAKIYKRMIQTDAAINPGNSGGPLSNIKGELIGINTFILSESGGSVGIGFAIPVNRVKKVVYELVQHKKIRKIDFGFRVKKSFYSSQRDEPLEIAVVADGSTCLDAGLAVGDILVGINGISIIGQSDINLAIIDIFVGDTVNLDIVRDSEPLQITYRIEEEH